MCEVKTKIKGANRLEDKGPLMNQRSYTAKLHRPKRFEFGAETFPKNHRHRFTFKRLKTFGQSDSAGCHTFIIATFSTIALSDYHGREGG